MANRGPDTNSSQVCFRFVATLSPSFAHHVLVRAARSSSSPPSQRHGAITRMSYSVGVRAPSANVPLTLLQGRSSKEWTLSSESNHMLVATSCASHLFPLSSRSRESSTHLDFPLMGLDAVPYRAGTTGQSSQKVIQS